jgi:hypothetical protein
MSNLPELSPTPEERAELVRSSPEWNRLVERWQFAKALAEPVNNACPEAIRGKPGAIFQILSMGAEMGMAPMQALMHLNVIKGRVSIDAQTMRALIYQRGHRWEYLERSSECCRIRGTRTDGAWLEACWTLEDAEAAKLLKADGGWETYPRAMLDARATSELARALFPDCLGWAAWTPEELGGPAAPADIGADVVEVGEIHTLPSQAEGYDDGGAQESLPWP